MTHLIRVLVFGLCLLAAGAHAADDSPLHEAVKSRDKAKIEALLAKGADVNAKNKDGETPLEMAAFEENKAIAELLLAKGADVNAKGELGWTPLHRAASGAYINVAEFLLAKGADVNTKNVYGETPLHIAAYGGSKGVAELLLAKGADVNAKDKNGETPLHRAAARGYRGLAEFLLAKGADVNTKNVFGETPRDSAERNGEKAVVELLNEHLANEVRVFNEQFRLQDEQRVEKARLLEEHRLKQVRLREDLIKSNPRAALVQLTAQLKGNPSDDTSRRLIIKLADELKPAPAIPEEARKHFVEGTAIVKAAKNPAQQALAAQSFTEALTVAPWWGDAYYNLGVAQELAEQYNEAEHAFTFYLLSNPGDQEKREAQDRIYALSAKRKLSGAK
mgnify:CR=1 FL=1